AIPAAALVPRGLHHPVPDGVGRGLELARQLLGALPAAHQLNQPVAELCRIRSTGPRHWDLLPPSEDRCPPNRVNSRRAIDRAMDILDEALREAKETLKGNHNVSFHKTNGYDLAEFGGGTIDCVYSFIAFFHFDFELVVHYFREVERVLRPGGMSLLARE